MQTHCHFENLHIVYQDDVMVAIHKPAGLLVHRSPIDKHETHFAVQMTRDLVGKPVYPIHRLDKPTSGLLLFAFDSKTAKALGEQFMNHSISKTYLAICRGWGNNAGEIDHPLKYKKDKIADKHKKQDDIVQDAITQYRTLITSTLDKPLGKFPQQRYSLIELKPKTGRKHQLRRHMNHINHPIIGDVKYGDRHHNHLFNDWLNQHRLYLAAISLKLIHPVHLKKITIHCPLESTFILAMNELGLKHPACTTDFLLTHNKTSS